MGNKRNIKKKLKKQSIPKPADNSELDMFDLMGMPSLSATMDEYFNSQNEEVDILPPDLPTTNPMDSHYALNNGIMAVFIPNEEPDDDEPNLEPEVVLDCAVPRPYICDICEKPFTSKRDLGRHKVSHTGQRAFACHICDFKCSRADNLRVHIRRHDKPIMRRVTHAEPRRSADPLNVPKVVNKPHKCTECSMGFATSKLLSRHMVVHTNHRPHHCSVCPKSFGSQECLKAHMRTHDGSRPHRCTECPWAFQRPRDLKRHMLSHTGEKPFECQHCLKRFRRSDDLLSHSRTHEDL